MRTAASRIESTTDPRASVTLRWCFVCVRRTLAMSGVLGNEWRSLAGFTL